MASKKTKKPSTAKEHAAEKQKKSNKPMRFDVASVAKAVATMRAGFEDTARAQGLPIPPQMKKMFDKLSDKATQAKIAGLATEAQRLYKQIVPKGVTFSPVDVQMMQMMMSASRIKEDAGPGFQGFGGAVN